MTQALFIYVLDKGKKKPAENISVKYFAHFSTLFSVEEQEHGQ